MRSVFRFRSLAVAAVLLALRVVGLSAANAPLSSHTHTAIVPLVDAQAPGGSTNVRVNAPAANPGTPLSCADSTTRCVAASGGEYTTITSACTASSPGDIIWVSAGTYTGTTSCSVSGTSGSPITILGNGTVNTCQWSFTNRSYIRLVNIRVDGNASGCSTSSSNLVIGNGTNTGLEFWDVTVTNTTGKGYWFDARGNSARCDKCIAIGGTVSNIGVTASQVAMTINGNDVFIGYVTFSSICYVGIGPDGNRGRYIGNKFSSLIACLSTHPDNFYFQGFTTIGMSNNLIDAMWVDGTPTSADNKVYHAQNQSAVNWNDNVLRFSITHDQGSASAFSIYTTDVTGNQINRWRQYNNDHILGNRAVSGDSFYSCGGGQAIVSGSQISMWIRNSIFYKCWADDVSIRAHVNPFGANTSASFTINADYNLAYDNAASVTFMSDWTGQAHKQSNVNPNFADVANKDFTLTAGSGNGSNARGTGGPLTTATSCSGTTLNVTTNTGSFFIGSNASNLPQYGGALAPGDVLTVGASTTRTVVSVSGDAITVDSSLTCSNGDTVYFGSTNSADIGALPYKSAGYTLSATKSCASGSCTITPNDPTLARMAVVFENGIPKGIATDANSWTVSVGTGVITAYIYPRYASQTLRVAIP